jgi:predicted metalloprotease
MRWENDRESSNVEDERGASGSRFGGGRGIGLFGTVAVVLVAMYFGVDPSVVLNQIGNMQQTEAPTQADPATRSPEENRLAKFSSIVLGETEDTWQKVFAENNRQYTMPKMVLFTGAVQSACGFAQAAMGPFYCPGDQKVYLDLSFFNELHTKFGAPGDFAQAYVIAHEVGHHVQNLLGISDKVSAAQQRTSKSDANALSVRLELQADCFAGVWANRTNESRHFLEQGDIESALNAAAGVGDDRLQRQAQGYVRPESFTHGSSEQRMRWFTAGEKSGDMNQCNTFKASQL